MSKLTLKNIGPIKDVVINLNKVNVLMGPQSSGKSTIAKSISYCQWVEKRFILDGKFNYKFSEQFMDFHSIDENYFSAKSLIKYESDNIYISYSGKNKKEEIKVLNDLTKFKKSKNIYIPAERNFVTTIPNLNKYNETNDNIMSFLYDWYDAKKTYTKKSPLNVLNLGIKYHHLEDTDLDVLALSKSNKEISLKNASSGLQSIIPLLMLVDYLTNEIQKKITPPSVQEKLQLYENNESLIKDYVKTELEKIKDWETEVRNTSFDKVGEAINKVSKKLEELDELISAIESKKQKWKNYSFSKIIVEEPEQNLFPTTQRDLIYYLINKIHYSDKNHSLILTTHSPYILYALNNCMLGFKVKENIDSETKSELLSSDSWINPDLVSVWEINDGKVNSIKNEKTGTISKHYFNQVMNDVMDEYYEMLNYLELE